MKRASLISLVDVVGFIVFAFLTSSGILLYYLLPPGSGRWAQLWGMNRHQWGEIHLWLAVLFFALMALHLFTHWHFILALFKGHVREGVRLHTALGLLGLIAVLLLAAAPLVSQVEVDAKAPPGHQAGEGYQRQQQPLRLHKP